MKTRTRRIIWAAILGSAISLASWDALGLGGGYGVGTARNPDWPKGVDSLVNATNRVRGFWVNFEDVFYFSGNATNFTAFLADYANLSGLRKHRLILHEGVGVAKAPWDKTGEAKRTCDWKLYGSKPILYDYIALQSTNSAEVAIKLAREKAAKEPGYILEVHFWTSGKIALNQIVVPPNVEITKIK